LITYLTAKLHSAAPVPSYRISTLPRYLSIEACELKNRAILEMKDRKMPILISNAELKTGNDKGGK
jgi:hypothetical protein